MACNSFFRAQHENDLSIGLLLTEMSVFVFSMHAWGRSLFYHVSYNERGECLTRERDQCDIARPRITTVQLCCTPFGLVVVDHAVFVTFCAHCPGPSAIYSAIEYVTA